MAIGAINYSSVNLKLKKGLSTRAPRIKTKLEKAKRKAFQEFISQFKAHPITREIAAGPHASNTSGTLGGYGNLFSFIGFEQGDNPTTVIEQYIINKLRKAIKIVPNTRGGGWSVVFDTPSLDDIAALSPIPWAGGRSWVVGIHSGISGLGEYMYTQRAPRYTTRSGTAFQVDSRLRGGRFQNTPYMIPLLKLLRKKINEEVRIAVRT